MGGKSGSVPLHASVPYEQMERILDFVGQYPGQDVASIVRAALKLFIEVMDGEKRLVGLPAGGPARKSDEI